MEVTQREDDGPELSLQPVTATCMNSEAGATWPRGDGCRTCRVLSYILLAMRPSKNDKCSSHQHASCVPASPVLDE